MTIDEYLNKLNEMSQEIFRESIKEPSLFGKAHNTASHIYEFSELITDILEKQMLLSVSSQLEYSVLNLALGLYRQSFFSLRLALEIGLGTVHFSIHKLEHQEWINGVADIKWATIIDQDNGVLSKRFAKAFFPELDSFISSERSKIISTYRALSEYVHGNKETWSKSGLVLKYDQELMKNFFDQYDVVGEVILFVLSCRYLKSMKNVDLDSVDFLKVELNHIDPIRQLFTR